MTLTRSSSMTRIAEEKGTAEEEIDEPTMPASDEEENAAVGDEDDEDSSEDENAHLKSLRPNSQISIRRNDSFNSFLTRSERAALLGKDKPPSPEEARKRKVKFVEDNILETVHEVDRVPDAEKPNVYMDGEDFSRMETDLKMTMFRWENHVSGHIPFDENANSMRGLEHMDRPAAGKKELAKYKHNRAVLEEIHRQKQDYGGQVRDWDVVRKISQQFSVHSMNHAVELGRQDREAFQRAWSSDQGSSHSSQSAEDGKKGDKKKKGKFRFWQKK